MRVVITGIGIVSPIGMGIDAFWTRLIQTPPEREPWILPETDDQVASEVIPKKKSQQDMKYFTRNTKDLTHACLLAVQDADLPVPDEPCSAWGMVLGSAFGNQEKAIDYHRKAMRHGVTELTPMDGMDCLPASPLNYAAIQLRTGGPNVHVASGMASGLDAIGEAYSLVKTGKAQVVIAGGFDYLHGELVEALRLRSLLAEEPETCRPFDRASQGLTPGEGSAVLVLESLDSALERGSSIYGEVVGYGNRFHPLCSNTSKRHTGWGGWQAMADALLEAGVGPEKLDYISASANGSQVNDPVEVSAIGHLMRSVSRNVAVSSIKGVTGECFGASGPLQCATALLAFKKEWIPSTLHLQTPLASEGIDYIVGRGRRQKVTYALVNSFDCFGFNAALLLSAPDRQTHEGGKR